MSGHAKNKMMDRSTAAELANSFKTLVFIERDIESMKIDLALKSDFNLIDAFRLFDVNACGSISKQDLVDGLQMNLNFGEAISPVDVALLYKRMDRDGKGRLSFN